MGVGRGDGDIDEFAHLELAVRLERRLHVDHAVDFWRIRRGVYWPQAHNDVLQKLLRKARKGARLVCGGKRHALGGTFFEPTIVADVTPAMRVAREEIFGPVAPLFRFHAEEEAIRMANDTEFGLAAYFYGRDIGRVWRVAEALEYGIVGINEGIISTEVAPFGGVKESGIGREGSKYGIDDFVEIKYLCMGGIR